MSLNSRLSLHTELVNLINNNNVYYQPPESLKINYPAIIYKRSGINNRFADNDVYGQSNEYEIIVVDPDPDSEIVEKMSKFKTARYIRHYTANNLNYDVFNIHYNKK